MEVVRQHAHSAYRTGGMACAVAATAILAVACTPGNARPQAEGARDGVAAVGEVRAEPVELAVDRHRQSDGVVAEGGADAVYNYGPTVMTEGGTVRMWWCSQYGSADPPGDDILHAEADSVEGPFTAPGGGIPDSVLSGDPGSFDGVHTCDPSVIRVDGTYYLYYTGAAGSHDHGNAIGLATSTDGRTWTRAAGNPVVRPAHDTTRDNTYGAGQPAAVYLDGWFYLMFTDTTGRAAGWNGAGQFVIRAKDPTFSTGVEALGPDGFTSVAGTGTPRTRSVVDAFSADLMWVDALDAFAIAHQTDRGTTITFWNRDFTATPYRPVLLPAPWEEGPGLVREPDGHAPVSTDDPCGRVPVDVIHATRIGEAGAPTALRHFGLDIHGVDGCATTGRALAVLDGFAMPSPQRTMDLVTGGKLLRIERRSVAETIAHTVLDERPAAVDRISVAARLRAGAPAVRALGEGTGFVLDGTLWPVTDAEAVSRNDSHARAVTDAEWRAYRLGPTLGARG
ncbi:beta-xylosidase [Prauserella oleivorans]|uniref:Beta-xylosidase n=1 Tax=Prauserella oleivorans TaxID=1478153 RepID=A0ABW5W8D1_9PSEU